jgi:hypothetical protein
MNPLPLKLETTNPLSAKFRLKMRLLTNCALVLGIFIPCAIFASPFEFAWAIDAVLIVLLWYFFFFMWLDRAIKIRCPTCTETLLTNTPWICGFCHQANLKADEYPFVDKCEHCGSQPKAYKCHYKRCQKLIFLTQDNHEENYARCINSPSAPSPTEEKKRAYEDLKTDMQYKIDIAYLEDSLKKLNERLNGPKIKTAFEQRREGFENDYSAVIGIKELAEQKRREAKERFKNHPELLEEALAAIKDLEVKYTP